MSTKKPIFTDVNGRKIYADLVTVDDKLRLKLTDDGEAVLLLNFYDAKQLEAAVKLFLGQRYGQNLAGVGAPTTPKDRSEMFEEELDEIEAALKEEAAEDRAKKAE
ncbi:hypothetical protein [Corynebacterium sp. 335C]